MAFALASSSLAAPARVLASLGSSSSGQGDIAHHALQPAGSSTVHALLYHGQYFRTFSGDHTNVGTPTCADYFACAQDHEQMYIAPLREAGKGVNTYFHTTTSGNDTRDALLVERLQPVSHRFVPHNSTALIVDGYINAIDLLLASGRHYDFATVLRFDLYFRLPLPELAIRWQSINLPWRAEQFQWDEGRVTSDLFAVMPSRFVGAYRDALVQSGEFDRPDAQGTSHITDRGSGHYVYQPLSLSVGAENIHFIDRGYHGSTQDIVNASDIPEDDLFLAILRACP